MKQYPFKFKLSKWSLEYWQSENMLGSEDYAYYIRIYKMGKKTREAWAKEKINTRISKLFRTNSIGLHYFWHDTIHAQLNLYYFCISWSSPWTKVPKDFWK